jgi:glucosamine--fructose-6-phosphate aminotransferase (isomerizing)
MCGIIGYSGENESVLNTLLVGLKRMEYRGYDSAGLAINTKNSVYSKKAVGKVINLEVAITNAPPKAVGSVGIAHTRWATHGVASVPNAHPHSSQDKNIWLVHNGILENYRELKTKLQAKGLSFYSTTDTEVIAKLIGYYYKGDLRKAVLKATKELKGAYALCIIDKADPDHLIGVKFGSPLAVGIAENEIIIASDVSAIIDRTKRVIYLEDGELIDVRGSDYEVITFQNETKQKAISEIDWDLESATKQGHAHYLLKEINEQPSVIRDSIRGRIETNIAEVKFGGLIDVADRLKDIDRIVLIGIGTSYYAAKLGELYFNTLTHIPTQAVMSPEFRYTKNNVNSKTWVIGISQSGETADTVAAIEESKRHGALVTGLVNVVGSTISRKTDAGIYNHIGPEISVASTKAFTSQSLLLLMQAILVGRNDGLDYMKAAKLLKAIQDLPNVIQQVLEQKNEIEKIAKKIYKSDNLIYIGRQYNYPIALEGALKIKELAYVHAEGLSGGELKHGFIALIDSKLITIALATDDSVSDKMLANIAEVQAREGKVIAITNQRIEGLKDQIIVPKAGSDMLQPLVNNIVLQLFAYYVAKSKGLNIDQPRNLAKSVTVE